MDIHFAVLLCHQDDDDRGGGDDNRDSSDDDHIQSDYVDDWWLWHGHNIHNDVDVHLAVPLGDHDHDDPGGGDADYDDQSGDGCDDHTQSDYVGDWS